jgi:hypothetical protein
MSSPERTDGLRQTVRRQLKAAREAGAQRAKQWNDDMIAEAEAEVPKGTRWGRGAIALVPAAAAAVVISLAIAEGILAANFNVANQPFALNVAQLDGKGLGAVLAVEDLRNANSSTDKTGVLHAGLASAQLKGVCIVVHQSLLGVNYTITVGSSGDVAASGDNLYFDITDLDATPATLRGAILGESADDVAVNGQSLGGTPGGFGLDNSRGTATMDNVVGSAYQAQVVGALKLPHLAIHVKLGKSDTC